MKNTLEAIQKAQIEADIIRIFADALCTINAEIHGSLSTTGRAKEIRSRIEARMLAILPGEEIVPASVASIVGLLTDPENQPHQFVGREDLLTKLLVIPVRHVLNNWIQAQGSAMTTETQTLIKEIEQALEGNIHNEKPSA